MTTDPKQTINIENVVASTGIGQELDLKSVAMDLEGADYDPEQFPGLVYRLDDPSVVALLFGSGKLVMYRWGADRRRRTGAERDSRPPH